MATFLIDTLEKYGLVSTQAIDRAMDDLPFRQITKIRGEIEDALAQDASLYASRGKTFSSFKFVASASFRGDSGCSSWTCHVQKAQMLARYAAVFCDTLIVPVSVSPHAEESQKGQRYVLGRGLLALAEMRPVIDAGVVVPVPSYFHYCPMCSPEVVPQVGRIREIKRLLTEALLDQFILGFEPGGKGRPPQLVLSGPEEYLEHGLMHYKLNKLPEWLSQRGVRINHLTNEQKKRSKLIDRLVNRIAMDVAAQQVYGTQFDAAYLTDRGGEAHFLTLLHEDDRLAARTAALCAQLAHSVPLFMDLPLDRVMRIRKEDYAAFDSYRVALSKILTEHVGADAQLSAREARELYSDVLEPQLVTLEQQAENEYGRDKRKTTLKYVAMAGAVAIGAYTGLLPAHITELCAAVGGFKLVETIAESIASIQKDPTAVRNSNLYFLLRLRQERD